LPLPLDKLRILVVNPHPAVERTASQGILYSLLNQNSTVAFFFISKLCAIGVGVLLTTFAAINTVNVRGRFTLGVGRPYIPAIFFSKHLVHGAGIIGGWKICMSSKVAL